MKLNILPGFTVYESPDAVKRDAEMVSDRFQSHSGSAHLESFSRAILRQLGGRVLFTFPVWNKVPTFLNHIDIVVLNGSEKEMVRINAAPNVATVKNVILFVKGTAKQFITDT